MAGFRERSRRRSPHPRNLGSCGLRRFSLGRQVGGETVLLDPITECATSYTEQLCRPSAVVLRLLHGLKDGADLDALEGVVFLANSADSELSNTTEFQVADVKPEMANTDMQIERLRRIADLSGGQCLSIPQFQELSSLVSREPYTTTVRTDRPLWDNGWVVFVLVGLMGFEWIVRRRYDLP